MGTEPVAGCEALERAIAALEGVRSAVVAFSGGVDSSVVAAAAWRVLGERMVAVTARSESNTEEDVAVCREVAAAFGFAHEVLEYSELAIENYASNPVNRCFFCKNELHGRLVGLARERGMDAVLDGTNVDDLGDYRPGLEAVARHGVRSPLVLAGMGKEAVRAAARAYGLSNHDRPAAPCLSSRIPHGQPVTKAKLEQIAAAEALLRGFGLRELRCRHHGDVARIEVAPEDFARVLEHRDAIQRALKGMGFRWVSLDLGGFRSGNLNPLRPGVGNGCSPNSGTTDAPVGGTTSQTEDGLLTSS